MNTRMLLVAFALSSTCLAQEKTPERPKPADYDQWQQALNAAAATAAETLETLPDFEVELLRSARPGEGSWIAMAFDPQGRLTISREDQGLFRLIIPDIAIDPRHEPPRPPQPLEEAIEAATEEAEEEGEEARPLPPHDPFHLRPIETTLKECRGLLYAYEALYAQANNSKGLYRLRDRDNDGTLEEVTLLRETPGNVGHGRNDLTLGPDGSIYCIYGNDVELGKDFQPGRSPLRNYAVDALLPCEWNKYLFNAGATVPGGHVMRTDAEGKQWEMVAGGFRNAYGIAFNPDGEMFTYDSDMEWDAGAPWYRPTRVHHIVSGADYGWRQGTGKFPAWMPESLPANLDVGLGSPTSVEFGTRSNFPPTYRDALFILEWAYGRIIAVHLTPRGASYDMTMETFVKGRPLNVTDLTFGPDGHMYFITGGRKTQSGLYRVKFTGSVPAVDQGETETEKPEARPTDVARAERRRLEEFHGTVNAEAVGVAWPYLASDDLWLRHAARVAIEAQPAATWSDRALAEEKPLAALTALLALARVGDNSLQAKLLQRLATFPLAELSAEERILALRTYELAFLRMGSPDAASSQAIAKRIDPIYPSDDERVDRLSCELLVYLHAPSVIPKTLNLLAGERSEVEKLHYLFCLRHVDKGWTSDQRKTLFQWLRKARGFAGAQYVPRFVHYIEQDCLARLTPAERDEVLPILNMKIEDPLVDLSVNRPVVKEWKLIDFIFELDKVGKDRDLKRGREMFAAARCAQCHKLGDLGKAVGPDLTGVTKRFNRRDLLVSILSPSTVIDDKYKQTNFEMDDGKIITGVVLSEDDKQVVVAVDPADPTKQAALLLEQIAGRTPSTLSPMPEHLLDTLKLDEILDLLAFIEAKSASPAE
jgi:putative heme-binding domain-containing protein